MNLNVSIQQDTRAGSIASELLHSGRSSCSNILTIHCAQHWRRKVSIYAFTFVPTKLVLAQPLGYRIYELVEQTSVPVTHSAMAARRRFFRSLNRSSTSIKKVDT
jgi:hypothetical protein